MSLPQTQAYNVVNSLQECWIPFPGISLSSNIELNVKYDLGLSESYLMVFINTLIGVIKILFCNHI